MQQQGRFHSDATLCDLLVFLWFSEVPSKPCSACQEKTSGNLSFHMVFNGFWVSDYFLTGSLHIDLKRQALFMLYHSWHAILMEYLCSSYRDPRKQWKNKHLYCARRAQYKPLKTNGKSTISAFPSTLGHCHEEPENEIPRHGILVNGIIGNAELGH